MDHPGRAAPADLTIVIPTYNEREGIADLVDAIFRTCDAEQLRLELVIVDDNSPDGTGALADDLAKRHRIQVIHRSGKLGLGTAVVAGFGVATADIVGVMDADFSHPPALVPRLFAIFKATSADIVVASRYIPGGRTLNWPVTRRVLSRVACMLARPLSPIRDAASGFFLIKRDIGTSVSIKAGGFKICLELIVRAWPRRLVEVPYQFDNRELGESKMSTREAMGYLAQLKDLFWLRMTGGQRASREYQQLTVSDVDAMVRSTTRVSASR